MLDHFNGKDKKLPSVAKRTNEKAKYLRELMRIFEEQGLERAILFMQSDANPDVKEVK